MIAKDKSNSNKFQAIIDRIEGDTAVLIFGEDKTPFEFPAELLPPSASEGSILSFNIKELKTETKKTKEEIQKIIKKLKKLE